MNDVEKTSIERTNSGKRLRRRKRMMGVYVFVVIVLVVTIFTTMCFTFLFNIDRIVVSGESEEYTSLQIVEASEINAGDNLLRLNARKGEQKILDKLTYVETATVDRDFPSTLRINVTRCIPAYNVRYDGGVLLVSRSGKILSDAEVYTDVEKIPIITGFMPDNKEIGTNLKSENSNKDDAFEQLVNRFEKGDYDDIATIDMTNEYDIIVTYRNDVMFKMGNWSDVDYKLDLAKTVLEDETIAGKKGMLVMIGKNQCSFRSNGETETETPVVTTAEGMENNPAVTTAVVPTVPEYVGF